MIPPRFITIRMINKGSKMRVFQHFPQGDPELQQALLKAGKSPVQCGRVSVVSRIEIDFRLPNFGESQSVFFCEIN